jgi:hypothetical protein
MAPAQTPDAVIGKLNAGVVRVRRFASISDVHFRKLIGAKLPG